MGDTMRSRYHDKKSPLVRSRVGKRGMVQLYTERNGQERLYGADDLNRHCHVYKEDSGLTEQIVYTHEGIMNHDPVLYFWNLYKTIVD